MEKIRVKKIIREIFLLRGTEINRYPLRVLRAIKNDNSGENPFTSLNVPRTKKELLGDRCSRLTRRVADLTFQNCPSRSSVDYFVVKSVNSDVRSRFRPVKVSSASGHRFKTKRSTDIFYKPKETERNQNIRFSSSGFR